MYDPNQHKQASPDPAKEERAIHGTAVAPGNAIERAICLGHPHGTDPELRFISPEKVESEIKALTEALKEADTKLQNLASGSIDSAQRQMIQFQSMMLKDRSVQTDALKAIKDGLRASDLPAGMELPPGASSAHATAVTAVWLAYGKAIARLQESNNEVFVARVPDVDHLRRFLISKLLGEVSAVEKVEMINEPCIVVANDLTPGQAAALKPNLVVGIVTAAGSKHGHVAVIAKSLKIPFVIIPEQELPKINSGELLIVDGDKGTVVVNPTDETKRIAGEEIATIARTVKRLPIAERAPKTKDGQVVVLAATMNGIENVDEIKAVRAMGVGLVRTEFIHLKDDSLLSEERQFEEYSRILKSFSPDPVVLRIMDLGADKVLSSRRALDEANPALGVRGIRLALNQKETILIPQIRAILRAAVFGEARILIPMVNDPGEIREVRRIISDQSRKLSEAGIPHEANLKIGAMVETPSAAFLAYRIFRECDFVNIGTNDMTQYTLALDRENQLVAHHYHPHHPALIETYRKIIECNVAEAKDSKLDRKSVMICGNAASETMLLPVFIGLGYRSFSIPSREIEEVNYNLSLLDSQECRKLVEELRHPIRGAATADEVWTKLLKFRDGLQLR